MGGEGFPASMATKPSSIRFELVALSHPRNALLHSNRGCAHLRVFHALGPQGHTLEKSVRMTALVLQSVLKKLERPETDFSSLLRRTMPFLEKAILVPDPNSVGLALGSTPRFLLEAAALARTSTFRVLIPAAIVLIGIWSSNCRPVDQCGWVAPNAAAARPPSILKQLSLGHD
jgi:hypothetical protein